jgi:hypothetical protein
MDDAEGFQTQPVGFLEVRLNHFLDILRPHGVQIENIIDRDSQRFVVVVHLPYRYDA